MNRVRFFSTARDVPSTWHRLGEAKRLWKPALLFVFLGSAAVNYNRAKKIQDTMTSKYEQKISILESIRRKLQEGEQVDLSEELKLINKSFEYLGYGGSYFQGHLEKPITAEEDELNEILLQMTDDLRHTDSSPKFTQEERSIEHKAFGRDAPVVDEKAKDRSSGKLDRFL